MLMFQSNYVGRLMEVGEADAETAADKTENLLDREPD
jgi:hypothetical protein